MSITIPNVPEFISREQYLALFEAAGLDPSDVVELRFAAEGIHALVFAKTEDGRRIVNLSPGFKRAFAEEPSDGKCVDASHPAVGPNGGGYHKHRVFIPVRHKPDDRRRTRIRPVN